MNRSIGFLVTAVSLSSLLFLAACMRGDDTGVMTGYVEAELVYVAAASAGTLQRLDVQRGQAVKKGQPLFALEPDAEALASDSAQARRERAQALADNLRKGRRPNELAAIDQQLQQARAALAASASALQRNQRLVDDGFLAPLRMEELLAARDRDAARLRELQAQRALADEASRSDEVAAGAADARAAGADLALARWRQGQRERLAPVDAAVFDVLARPGEWVNAGAPVVALLPPTALKLRFFVPEPALSQAVAGREVQVSCDGCAIGLRARIRWVSPQAEFTPPVIYSVGSRGKLVFMVEAEPTDPRAFKPGQPVDVRWASAAP